MLTHSATGNTQSHLGEDTELNRGAGEGVKVSEPLTQASDRLTGGLGVRGNELKVDEARKFLKIDPMRDTVCQHGAPRQHFCVPLARA